MNQISLLELCKKQNYSETDILLFGKAIDLAKSGPIKKRLSGDTFFEHYLRSASILVRSKSSPKIIIAAILQGLENKKENIEKDISLLDKHIETLKKQILELSKFDNFHKLKQRQLKSEVIREREIEIFLAELKKEFELVKEERHDLEKTIELKEISKKRLLYLLELRDWLSSDFMELIDFTESNILLKLREEFSVIFSKWFKILVTEGHLNVRLDESFSPIIMHRGTEMEYSSISGGERTAVALAYRLALNQTVNSFLGKIKTKDIIMLDEPTDGFSEVQLDRMKVVLEELNVSQLIIVSHEHKIEPFAKDYIRIKKEGEVSYLENLIPQYQKTKKLKYLKTFKNIN